MELRLLEWVYLGSHSRWHEDYISGVPRCEWSCSGAIPGGCSPCAATMVLGYWGNRGYGSLPEIDWDSMGSTRTRTRCRTLLRQPWTQKIPATPKGIISTTA
jgi:hypothetical protein